MHILGKEETRELVLLLSVVTFTKYKKNAKCYACSNPLSSLSLYVTWCTGKTQVKDFFVLEYIKDPR